MLSDRFGCVALSGHPAGFRVEPALWWLLREVCYRPAVPGFFRKPRGQRQRIGERQLSGTHLQRWSTANPSRLLQAVRTRAFLRRYSAAITTAAITHGNQINQKSSRESCIPNRFECSVPEVIRIHYLAHIEHLRSPLTATARGVPPAICGRFQLSRQPAGMTRWRSKKSKTCRL